MSLRPSPDQDIGIQIEQGSMGDHCHPPHPGQDQASQRLSHSSDTSIPLFALYLQKAEDLALRKYGYLQGDADRIVIFCGLFSATVAALTVPFTPGLNSTYSSNSANRPQSSHDIKINTLISSLWLWSLFTNIFCATVALSIPRWARPKSMITSSRYSLPEQARLHAFFADGLKKSKFAYFIQVLYCLVHISICLFLSGLWLFLDSVAVWKIGLAGYIFILMAYIFFSVSPVIRPGFPCSTPLSPIFAIAYACVVQGTSRLLSFTTSLIRIRKGRTTQEAVPPPKNYYRGWSLRKLAEDRAQGQAPLFDDEILERTLHMLRTDDDLEQFFDAIPGFCGSKIVHDPQQSLDTLGQQRLAEALIGFWNRTLSSNLVPESTKGRRLLVCMEAIEAAKLATAVPGTLRGFSLRYLGGITRSIELGHSLGNLRHGNVASLARGIIAGIISKAERNDHWSTLAVDELDIARDVLRDYLTRGDSVLLANLIHITRYFLHSLPQHPDLTREALSILPSVSKFDIRDTLPELQHSFCALWNDVVRQAQSSGAENNPFMEILLNIWGLYVALHRTTASTVDPMIHPASYPLCEDGSHRNLTTHVQCVDGNISGDRSGQ